MGYLLIAIFVGAGTFGWLWWSARNAPHLYDDERTSPPYEPPRHGGR